MANTALTRSFGTATNTKKFTISVWLKRSSLATSGYQHIWHTTDGTYDGYFRFRNSENQLQLNMGIVSPNAAINYRPNRAFRDVNSWYHVVVAVDTTLSTASDRVKFYINGTRETSFQSSDAPTQNISYDYLSSSGLGYIGRDATSAQHYFDGSMSHFHFIDGTTYDPSAFGETDTTTGEWKAKTSPSVTYGNNGYFILKDSNGVTDQSGKGNNFTVASGTLTNLKDNPDNVFATLNPLARFPVAPTYSNGNNTITAGAGGSGSSPFSTIGASSGKYYAEFSLGSVNGGGISCGIIDITQFNPNFQTDAWFYYPTYGYAYISNNGKKATNNAESNYANSYTNGDKIGVAMDLDNNKLYFAKNGVWQNSGDPTSGATGTGSAFTIADGTYGFAVYGYQQKVWNANFGNGFFGTTAITTNSGNGYSGAEGSSKFNYTVPTGYSALSTKGLNE